MNEEIKLDTSKEYINLVNTQLNLELGKISDIKTELYLLNCARVFEKYKDKIHAYELEVDKDDDNKYHFSLTLDFEKNAVITNSEEDELNDAVSNYEILTQELMDTVAWSVKEYYSKNVTIYNDEDILLSLSKFIYGEEAGELWLSEKKAIKLNKELQESIPEKSISKKPKI